MIDGHGNTIKRLFTEHGYLLKDRRGITKELDEMQR